MEMFTARWFSALLSIVLIDLVLAGDNALVIGMAARRLPEASRRKAIVWGTVGAIGLRCLMTLGVVWLLQIPGLMLVGGLGLLWVAYSLLAAQDSDPTVPAAPASLGSALKTIVIADALMGVDNVLGVAGAAHGAWDLVLIGLLISIPVVVWGSQVVVRWIERFPSILYIGSGVLAWTAAKMILGEAWIAERLVERPWTQGLLPALLVVAVLAAGRLAARKHLLKPAP